MITPEKIDHLRASIGGSVALMPDPAYQKAVAIDNGRVQRHPALIVFPINARDIAIAIQFARANNILFTVRGGGHSATGYCLNDDGMVLDMSQLKGRQLDEENRTLYVQAGYTWTEIYQFLKAGGTGLVPVGGACSTVGIGGFMLGGGVSFLSRSYGLASDNLLALTIVLADGSIRQLRRDDTQMSQEDQDLFWACQGGGGGNFGVVVDMTLRLHKTNATNILGGMLYYPLDRAQEVLAFYNEWIKTVPDTLAVYGYLGMAPAGAGQQIQTVRFEPVFNGSYEEGLNLIAPLLELKPFYVNLYDTDLIDFEMAVGTSTLVANRSAYIRSATMPKGALTPEVADIFQKAMSAAPSASSFAIWMHTGGKITEKSDTATAYPHRNAEFVFQLKTIWDDPATALENIEWGYEFVEQLLRGGHADGAYVNYIDPLLKDWKKRYYGENVAWLLKVKHRVDPDNFFHFQQGVSSEFEPRHLDFRMPDTVDLSPLNRTFWKQG